MHLGLRAALLFSSLQWKHWERQTRDPATVQKRLLLEIIQRNQSTTFGRAHSFSSIKSVDDFRKRVPIGDYESFRPTSSAPSKAKARCSRPSRF